jgi:HlyD family secretion protein
LAAVAAAAALFAAGRRPAANRDNTATALVGPLSRWSSCQGELDARRVDVVMSSFSGNATIVELAPEGAFVRAGDLLVRFDDAEVTRSLLRLEHDHALAVSELESLEKAKLPIELRELEMQELEAKAAYEAESRYLADSRELLDEDLVTSHEIEQQALKVERARAVADKLSMQLMLTRRYLHPDRLERARAALSVAEQELALARRQLAHCTVTAPSDGSVVYRPLHLGAEYRTARVGDSIYQNKPFMALPDMRDLIVECFVPEAELSLVRVENRVAIAPLAYPALELDGRVEQVGATAQALPGRGAWQKYFRVVVAVDTPHAALRPGMTVQARILSYHRPDALLIPRAAVSWENGVPVVRVRHAAGWRKRPIRVGQSNDAHFEVTEGLSAGETVLMP